MPLYLFCSGYGLAIINTNRITTFKENSIRILETTYKLLDYTNSICRNWIYFRL